MLKKWIILFSKITRETESDFYMYFMETGKKFVMNC